MNVVEGFDALALAADSARNRDAVEQACAAAGLAVVPLDADLDRALFEDPRVALRLPVGLAARARARDLPVRLSAPSAAWFAALPVEVTRRRLAVVDVGRVRRGDVPLPQVRLVKLASAKHRGLIATRTRDAAHAAQVVEAAGVPDATELLVADAYLDCDSEYRTFTVGREVVACSPYVVEGEVWSRDLVRHRASFHEQAEAFVAGVLRALPSEDVPPACVLDVARLPDGGFALLEVNTSWGAGLYGCDPAGVLRSVLAANGSAQARWRWRPDPGLQQLTDG